MGSLTLMFPRCTLCDPLSVERPSQRLCGLTKFSRQTSTVGTFETEKRSALHNTCYKYQTWQNERIGVGVRFFLAPSGRSRNRRTSKNSEKNWNPGLIESQDGIRDLLRWPLLDQDMFPSVTKIVLRRIRTATRENLRDGLPWEAIPRYPSMRRGRELPNKNINSSYTNLMPSTKTRLASMLFCR